MTQIKFLIRDVIIMRFIVTYINLFLILLSYLSIKHTVIQVHLL